MPRRYPLSDQRLFRYVFAQAGQIQSGLYRTNLGTTGCVVCNHYCFQRDDIGKIIAWGRYMSIVGITLTEQSFWLKNTMLAPVSCPICKARYVLWMCKWIPYNLSFFYSFSERPAIKDLEAVDPKWLTPYSTEPVPETDGELWDEQGVLTSNPLCGRISSD